MKRGGRFVTRVFVAFAVVAVPPVLLLAAVVAARLSRTFEESSLRRARHGLEAADQRIARLRDRAEERLAAIGGQDLEALSTGDPSAAEAVGARHDLPVLTVTDGEGRVLSSRHWPAGFGLPDRSRALRRDRPFVRRELVAQGYGASERLAVVAARTVSAGEQPLTLRGGSFLDEDLATELSALLGAEAGVFDERERAWITPPRSPLRGWTSPGFGPGSGTVRLGGAGYTWAARELVPSLWLVVADARRDEEELLARLRNVTLGVAGAALLLALAAGAWISRRVTRPVRALAHVAKRIAAGDLAAEVVPRGGRELEDLADAFNRMTAELRDSRERLRQAERVAAWREMARRLAHELKNPLFPIQLSIETLQRAQERGEKRFPELFREAGATILEELGTLRRTVDEFSQFARMPRPQPRPTDLNAVVEQVLALYEARAAGATVERELATDLPIVTADPELLSRAVSNLVANALEAMPAGGTLRVRTTAAAGGGVAVEVADSGPGLDEEQRTRLFTPYFTTKRGGTGLGLAIVQGIVADHGGRVDVTSAPGEGTSFTLVLPRVPAPSTLNLAEEHDALPPAAPPVRDSAP